MITSIPMEIGALDLTTAEAEWVADWLADPLHHVAERLGTFTSLRIALPLTGNAGRLLPDHMGKGQRILNLRDYDSFLVVLLDRLRAAKSARIRMTMGFHGALPSLEQMTWTEFGEAIKGVIESHLHARKEIADQAIKIQALNAQINGKPPGVT